MKEKARRRIPANLITVSGSKNHRAIRKEDA
jgi:hypothetical protein